MGPSPEDIRRSAKPEDDAGKVDARSEFDRVRDEQEALIAGLSEHLVRIEERLDVCESDRARQALQIKRLQARVRKLERPIPPSC